MRADRSLIPGLGAAVSLVAAVACAFFVTAAVVAFHRWPQAASTNDARAVVVAGDRHHARSIVAPTARASRTPTHTASAAPQTARTVHPATVADRVKPSGTRTIVAVEPKVHPTPTPTTSTTTRPHVDTNTTPTLPPDTLAGTTQVTATNVGGLVNGLTNGVAKTVAPINPQLADTVNNLGNSVSGAVISVGNNLAELLLGLTPSQ